VKALQDIAAAENRKVQLEEARIQLERDRMAAERGRETFRENRRNEIKQEINKLQKEKERINIQLRTPGHFEVDITGKCPGLAAFEAAKQRGRDRIPEIDARIAALSAELSSL
jgi:hypothetical protein